jgi:hypothetical protein
MNFISTKKKLVATLPMSIIQVRRTNMTDPRLCENKEFAPSPELRRQIALRSWGFSAISEVPPVSLNKICPINNETLADTISLSLTS